MRINGYVDTINILVAYYCDLQIYNIHLVLRLPHRYATKTDPQGGRTGHFIPQIFERWSTKGV